VALGQVFPDFFGFPRHYHSTVGSVLIYHLGDVVSHHRHEQMNNIDSAPVFLLDSGVGQTQVDAFFTLGRITHSPHDMSLESHCGMIYLQGKTEELGEKPVPVPLCPPQILHGLTRARTRASAVTGRRLTT
jgi:hypothetical protein